MTLSVSKRFRRGEFGEIRLETFSRPTTHWLEEKKEANYR